MPRGRAPWTAERRQRHSEAVKERWAQKKLGQPRRIAIRDTVHIFKECLATLDLLQHRFRSLSTMLRELDEPVYIKTADQCLTDAEVVRRAMAALAEVIVLKQAIELPELKPISEESGT